MRVMNWIYALDDAALPEGHMVPACPKGAQLVLAGVEGTAYALSGACVHNLSCASSILR